MKMPCRRVDEIRGVLKRMDDGLGLASDQQQRQ